jgi:multicomponent Na+:H+ antiporter subunit G
MATLVSNLSHVALAAAVFFFVAGTLGALRFPDVYTRLHAVTKADNLGLGLLVLGLALEAGSIAEVLKLCVTWLLILVAGSAGAHLIARAALHEGVKPWR